MQPTGNPQQPATVQATAGWYPAENGAMRWWDGTQWAPAAPAADNQRKLIITISLIGALLGLFLSMQSVSILTGTGKVWTGAAIAVASFVLVMVMLRKVRWLVITVGLIAALAIGSATYMEVQLQNRINELDRMFDE